MNDYEDVKKNFQTYCADKLKTISFLNFEDTMEELAEFEEEWGFNKKAYARKWNKMSEAQLDKIVSGFNVESVVCESNPNGQMVNEEKCSRELLEKWDCLKKPKAALKKQACATIYKKCEQEANHMFGKALPACIEKVKRALWREKFRRLGVTFRDDTCSGAEQEEIVDYLIRNQGGVPR